MAEAAFLHCPIRGQLSVPQRAKDRLTFTEEKWRIDALRFLLHREYPKEHFHIETTLFRFGHEGRNSFRIDFSLYNEPYEDIKHLPINERINLIKVVAEIKRDNKSADKAKAMQVRPALDRLPDLKALGIYWDDIEQRFFYRTLSDDRIETHEAPISKIPPWGASVGSTRLTYNDLDTASNLVKIFDQLEDALHTYITDKSKRYTVFLQILLAKIYDENRHKSNKNIPLDIQDFFAEAITDSMVIKSMNETLKVSLGHYQNYLPERVPTSFGVPSEALRRASQILAPINILESKKEVIQSFYMKFAKNLYRWDLAQYFTPHEVVDFMVEVTNPGYGEHVKDPACGSADFLISAYRHGSRFAPDFSQCVWGSDHSGQAVQISVLNMLLNGDGRSNIKEEDSLEGYNIKSHQYDIVLCNPPFGTKINERRWEVLRKFDLGHDWEVSSDGQLQQSENVSKAQQTGILFAELCVRLTRPGGRIGIILPNGYLGNRGTLYLALREWLLRHTYIVGIAGFPRFTFKKSGADVSASAVFLERRMAPLARAADSSDYSFYIGMVESVGWRVGDKQAVPLYQRDSETGAPKLDVNNDPILDTDFPKILEEFLRSAASNQFPWLLANRSIPQGSQGWSVAIDEVANDSALILDPKRFCPKFINLRKEITHQPYFTLGEVLESIKEPNLSPEAAKIYRYVEIQNVGVGHYDYESLRGWELPDRAKLLAKLEDIFVAAVWSSVGKWFMVNHDCDDLIVTSGCIKLRLIPSKRDYLVDIVAGLSSEAFRVQMRGFATGSDGLAEIAPQDLLEVVLPRLQQVEERQQVQQLIDTFLISDLRFSKAMSSTLNSVPYWPKMEQRKSHWILV